MGNRLRSSLPQSNLQYRSHKDPYHIIQESICAQGEAQFLTDSLHGESMESADRGFFKMFIGAEGKEIMGSQTQGHSLFHSLFVQRLWNRGTVETTEYIGLGRVPNTLAIGFLHCG